jgi:hypothetical protein
MNVNSHEMQIHVDIYLSNDETHVPWRIRMTTKKKMDLLTVFL